jgi:hypothetical protein
LGEDRKEGAGEVFGVIPYTTKATWFKHKEKNEDAKDTKLDVDKALNEMKAPSTSNFVPSVPLCVFFVKKVSLLFF